MFLKVFICLQLLVGDEEPEPKPLAIGISIPLIIQADTAVNTHVPDYSRVSLNGPSQKRIIQADTVVNTHVPDYSRASLNGPSQKRTTSSSGQTQKHRLILACI